MVSGMFSEGQRSAKTSRVTGGFPNPVGGRAFFLDGKVANTTMPAYGRRGMPRRTGYSRTRSYRSSGRKVAVPRAPRRTRPSYTRSNALAINQLARQVAHLKRRDWGPVQVNQQVMTEATARFDLLDVDEKRGLPVNLDWGRNKHPTEIEVSYEKPLLFDVNNYDKAKWNIGPQGVAQAPRRLLVQLRQPHLHPRDRDVGRWHR